jgi:hypothetical protein
MTETDKRQGVSPAVHAVLDRLDEYTRRQWRPTLASLLETATNYAEDALEADEPSRRQRKAREAAALLLHALEMMDREAEGGR